MRVVNDSWCYIVACKRFPWRKTHNHFCVVVGFKTSNCKIAGVVNLRVVVLASSKPWFWMRWVSFQHVPRISPKRETWCLFPALIHNNPRTNKCDIPSSKLNPRCFMSSWHCPIAVELSKIVLNSKHTLFAHRHKCQTLCRLEHPNWMMRNTMILRDTAMLPTMRQWSPIHRTERGPSWQSTALCLQPSVIFITRLPLNYRVLPVLPPAGTVASAAQH